MASALPGPSCVSRWKPERPGSMISDGPPYRVANVGRPVEQRVHPHDLLPLVRVVRRARVGAAPDHQEVRRPAETLGLTEPLHETGEVLDPVEARHRVDERLAAVREGAPRARRRLVAQHERLQRGRERGETPLPVGVREVDLRIGARRDDVELRVEQVDPGKDPVEPRQRVGDVPLVLSRARVGARDLLVRAVEDEVRGVHGDEVGGVLAGEVVAGLVLLPAEPRQRVLGDLERVRDVALRDAEPLAREHRQLGEHSTSCSGPPPRAGSSAKR